MRSPLREDTITWTDNITGLRKRTWGIIAIER